jgi:rare lipoprotein A
MRFFALAAVAALSIALVDARAANAAWECQGPAVACGNSGHVAKKSAYKKASYKKESHKKKVAYSKKAYRSAKAEGRSVRRTSRSVVSSGSYGGGSSGVASYYWQGQQTASGARFNPNGLTAAHRSLPFGTRVLVTNQSNGRSVTVTINDRGPFIKGRIIDLSRGAAQAIGMTGAGLARVSIAVQ